MKCRREINESSVEELIVCENSCHRSKTNNVEHVFRYVKYISAKTFIRCSIYSETQQNQHQVEGKKLKCKYSEVKNRRNILVQKYVGMCINF